MEISNSTKAYKAPQAKAIEVKVQSVLCGSENGDTEKFILGDNRYDESEWE